MPLPDPPNHDGALMNEPPPRAENSVHKATAWVLFVAVAYVLALWWFDRDKQIQRYLADLAGPLLISLVPVFLSYLIRYGRWRYLLQRQGSCFSFGRGFLGYLSGFAFTATPGKTGELIRIRYFARMGVAPERTFGVFVFERALDLLVILLLSLFAAALMPVFGTLAAVVLLLVVALAIVALWPTGRRALGDCANRLPGAPVRRLAGFLLRGADELGAFLGFQTGLLGLSTGAIAWLLTSLVFVAVVHAMGVELPWPVALGIYPLAMLVGALSFVPGGVGTTELAIVLMLKQLGIETGAAMAAAVGVRLVTLWFAVAIGMLALLMLELRPGLGGKHRL